MNQTLVYLIIYKKQLFSFLLILFLFCSEAGAASVPFFMSLPVGQDVTATFIQNGQRLSVHKSIEGKLYLPEGPSAGAYSLELQSVQFPDQKVVMDIKIDYTPHGLATVVRPTLPWAKGASPAEDNNGKDQEVGGQEGAFSNAHSQQKQGVPDMNVTHILIIMMMGISLLAVLVIMRKKGKLPPLKLPEKLTVKLPDRVVKRLSFLASAPQSLKPSPGTKTIEMASPVKAAILKDLEKTLRKKGSFVRIPGETVQMASTWNADLGDIILTSMYSKGGVGAVYRGHGSNDPSRELAIKFPLSHIVEKKSLADIESIRSEFESNKRFGQNSRLIRFYELRQIMAETKEDSAQFPIFYSVMEFFGGMSLKELIRSNALDLHGKLSVAIELLEALGPVHMQGITHNDIKPGNVLINYNSASKSVTGAKLIDFGSANLSNKASLDYASPELLLKQFVSPKSDLFSLGILFYELFEGGLPFTSGNGQGGTHITSASEFDLHFLKLNGQEVLQDIIRGMLVKNPAARAFGAASDVLAQLRTI